MNTNICIVPSCGRQVGCQSRSLCTRCAHYIYYHAARVTKNPRHFEQYEQKRKLANARVSRLGDAIQTHVVIRKQEKRKKERRKKKAA